jgi:hypothetical protein
VNGRLDSLDDMNEVVREVTPTGSASQCMHVVYLNAPTVGYPAMVGLR